MMTYQNITRAQVAKIASRYGLKADEPTVVENAKYADSIHGKVCEGFDGNLQRFWHCDSSGRYNAANALAGYLAEETRVMRCDDLAHRQFQRDAYGY